MARRTPGMSIDEYLDSEYHSKVPMFPGVVRDNDTDDFLAWKLGCIAMKASHVLSWNYIFIYLPLQATIYMSNTAVECNNM